MSKQDVNASAVIITPYPNPDNVHAKNTGVGSYSVYLCKALAESGLDIEIWAQKDNYLLEYVDIVKDNRISVKRVWHKSVTGLFALIEKLWHDQPTVVHIQHEFNIFGGPSSAVLSPLLPICARLFGSRVVTTMHGGFGLDQVDSNFVKENGYNVFPILVKVGFILIFGLIAHSSHEIIVHEEFQRNELIKGYLVPGHKIKVIPHGVPDQEVLI